MAWAAENQGTGLSAALVATAHRAAGDLDEYVTWQQYRKDGTIPEAAWPRQLKLAENPTYLARPFAEPTHWAAFALFGAG